jgi:hypothetical protein
MEKKLMYITISIFFLTASISTGIIAVSYYNQAYVHAESSNGKSLESINELPSQFKNIEESSCPYENDGVCDVPNSCIIGTDLMDCQ